MDRLLLLLPTATYRTEAFVEAARRLGIDLVCASEQPSTFEARAPDRLLTLDLADADRAAAQVAALAAARPLRAVVGVDDQTAVVAAAIAERLGLTASPLGATRTARDKHAQRRALRAAGVPVPAFRPLDLDGDLAAAAAAGPYPCVLKPLSLSASRGVIRADDPAGFVAAARRIAAILARADVSVAAEARRRLLVEAFVPGAEVALEGMLLKGVLHPLALFDKPDPLDGPYFEETIYVTPSRLPPAVQAAVTRTVGAAAQALGLSEGPLHAELRVNAEGPWVLEVAARSIGGLCSRTLRFGAGVTLEELILRHALGWPIESLERERGPAGVMMLPIPRAGRLRRVSGQEAARDVPGIEDLAITAHPGQELEPLPEGWQYLGFLFARAATPEAVEMALREAHRRLSVEIE